MKTNKILVESSIGDLIDRITILEIKKFKISNKTDLKHINKECLILKKILRKNVKINRQIKKLWKNLKYTNNKTQKQTYCRSISKNSNFGKWSE